MDFTLKTYQQLLKTLIAQVYHFLPLEQFLYNTTSSPKSIFLRHDVDRLPANALQTAQIEYSLGITSTYNFRIIPSVFKPKIIQQIASLGYEIGYHYEDLSLAAKEVRSRKYEVGSEEERDQKSEGEH
jgi:hypothetical protein